MKKKQINSGIVLQFMRTHKKLKPNYTEKALYVAYKSFTWFTISLNCGDCFYILV